MDFPLALGAIWLANLLGAMSPGPAFVVVAREAAERSRAAGLAATAGVALGALAWAAAAMFGLALLFAKLAWLYRAVQVAGALYLVWLAVLVWRGAREPFAPDGRGRSDGRVRGRTHWRAFLSALALQLSNPKVVVFFGSIFVALLPQDAPAWVWAATLLIVAVNETAWYAVVALAFSADATRRAYGRAKRWLDRAMAGFLGLIGAKLLLDAR